MLCRALNIAQSLAEVLQTSLTSTEQAKEQYSRGAKQSSSSWLPLSSWLPFSSKPQPAERTEHAVRHVLVLPSVWHYGCLYVPAKLPQQLSGSCRVMLDGLLPA